MAPGPGTSTATTTPAIMAPVTFHWFSKRPWHRHTAVWMTGGEAELFTEVLMKNREGTYLEFGSGGSTLFAAGIAAKVISVENDPGYIRSLKRRVLLRPRRSWPQFIVIDQGPVKDWGFPTTTDPTLLTAYAETVWKDASLPQRVRTVLVDGRFRRSCLLHTLLHLDPSIDIMVHDADRYDDLLSEFFVEEKRVHMLRLVHRKPGVTDDQIRARLLQVQYDPE